MVSFESKTFVGFYGIQPLVLQFISLQLGHQADAPAFLLFVDQDARALLCNHGQRHFQLFAAVAAQRTEDISSEALRVDAEQRRRGMNVSHDEGYRIFIPPRHGSAEFSAKAVDAKFAPAGGEVGGGYLSNLVRRHINIIAGCSDHDSRLRRHRAIADARACIHPTLCPGGESGNTRPAWTRWERHCA